MKKHSKTRHEITLGSCNNCSKEFLTTSLKLREMNCINKGIDKMCKKKEKESLKQTFVRKVNDKIMIKN